jgi:NADH:ubiquinone oxidoreductase subunit 6 (subunit J)
MKNNKLHIFLAISLIVASVISRIVCNQMHWANMAPLAAVGLFSGAVISNKRYAFLLPVLGQLLADIYFQFFTATPGFYDISQLFVYAGLVMATLIGTQMGKPQAFKIKPQAFKILGFSVLGSVAFFMLSNFGVWCSIEFGTKDLYGYGKGWQGLNTTFVKAVPFFRSSLLADLYGSIALFGLYFLLQLAFISKLQKAKA